MLPGTCESKRAGRAMLHAFGCGLFQTLLDCVVQRGSDSNIKATAHERKPQGFSGEFSQFHANATKDAFARLKHDATRMRLPFELLSLRTEAVRIRAVFLRVMLQETIA